MKHTSGGNIEEMDEFCLKQCVEIERLRDKIRLLEWYKETGVMLAKEVAWLRRENELLTMLLNGKDDGGG